jgi:hypothetical protein
MYQTNIHKPRTLLLNLGGPRRKAGVRYPYWIVSICSFLSSGDLFQNQHPEIRDAFWKLLTGFVSDSAKTSIDAGISSEGNHDYVDGTIIREQEIPDNYSFYRDGVSGTAVIRISWNHWTREGNL